MAPGTALEEWTSAKKPEGFSSIFLTLKPKPLSLPVAAFMTPVTKPSLVPVMQPMLRRVFLQLETSTGLGKAMRGGPALPAAASWMWVAETAGDWYSPWKPVMVML